VIASVQVPSCWMGSLASIRQGCLGASERLVGATERVSVHPLTGDRAEGFGA
jgi:prephenate dehydrogenase